MEKIIMEYLRILQRIAIYKGDDEFASTPYTFNAMRTDIHEKLFNELYERLNPVCNKDESYWRSKEIFARLDRVFRLYNDFDLDLKNGDHLLNLSKDLNRFLSSAEVRFYIEGRTNGIHNVIDDGC